MLTSEAAIEVSSRAGPVMEALPFSYTRGSEFTFSFENVRSTSDVVKMLIVRLGGSLSQQ